MNGHYKVSIDVPCLEFLFACPRRQRHQLLKFFDSLASDPFQRGDHEEYGLSGRAYQVKGCRPFAVTFWADHAVKEVRVVSIKKV